MQRSSGMLLFFAGYLFTDVLAPSSRVKEIKKKLYFLTAQSGIDNFSRNIGNKILIYSAHSLHRRRECDLLSCYASCDNSLPTFRNYKSVPFSKVKSEKMGVIGCPETFLKHYHNTLRNSLEERRSHLLRGGNLISYKILEGNFTAAET